MSPRTGRAKLGHMESQKRYVESHLGHTESFVRIFGELKKDMQGEILGHADKYPISNILIMFFMLLLVNNVIQNRKCVRGSPTQYFYIN